MVCAGGVIWDILTGREVATLRDDRGRGFQLWAARSVIFNPDGKEVIATDQFRVNVFDPTTGKEIRRIATSDTTKAFNAIALSPDGRFLALLSDSVHTVVRLLHLDSGREIAEPLELGKNGETGETLEFSPDGRLLAAGRGYPGGLVEGSVRVWELASGREICTFREHRAHVTSIAFLPDSSRIVSAGADAIAMVWEIGRTEQPSSNLLACVK